ncbi:proteasome assembly chaperone 4 isoform X1 [Gallus gallus]|uniref:proteasome assembly chaperone 4 isoform X1 n=1 Tax=Gallus gallus TaxID=9031 RepID=UPI001AE89BB9|nr:proteasome assembly chaperone 4 isoform X1 [Gallus gallus]
MSVTQREELRAHEKPAAHTQPLPAQLCHSPASLSLEADPPNLAGAVSGTETPNPPPSSRHFEGCPRPALSRRCRGGAPRGAAPGPAAAWPGRWRRQAAVQRRTVSVCTISAGNWESSGCTSTPCGCRTRSSSGWAPRPPCPAWPWPCATPGVPVSTSLLGDPSDTASACLAQRLAKKTKKQVFVSYNLPNTDSSFTLLIENRIKEEMMAFPEKF